MSPVPMKFTLTDQVAALLTRATDAGLGTRSDLVNSALSTHLEGLLGSVHPLAISWNQFFQKLIGQHGARTTNGDSMFIFDDESSYETELERCRDAFESVSRFEDLDETSRALIAGWGPRSTGFFGNFAPAAKFKGAVRNRPAEIGEWLDKLPLHGPIEPSVEKTVLEGLLKVSGVGLPAATRVLTVKRPDLYFSVNSASIDRINDDLVKIRANSNSFRVDDYLRALELIHTFPWWQSEAPCAGKATRKERIAWKARTALLDAFFYAKDSVTADG